MCSRSAVLLIALLCIGSYAMARPVQVEPSTLIDRDAVSSERNTDQASLNRKLLQTSCCCSLRSDNVVLLTSGGTATECATIAGFYYDTMDCRDSELQVNCDRGSGFLFA